MDLTQILAERCACALALAPLAPGAVLAALQSPISTFLSLFLSFSYYSRFL